MLQEASADANSTMPHLPAASQGMGTQALGFPNPSITPPFLLQPQSAEGLLGSGARSGGQPAIPGVTAQPLRSHWAAQSDTEYWGVRTPGPDEDSLQNQKQGGGRCRSDSEPMMRSMGFICSAGVSSMPAWQGEQSNGTVTCGGTS